MITTIVHGLNERALEMVKDIKNVNPVAPIESPLGPTGEWILQFKVSETKALKTFVQCQFFDATKDYNIYLGLRDQDGKILEDSLWTNKEMNLIIRKD